MELKRLKQLTMKTNKGNIIIFIYFLFCICGCTQNTETTYYSDGSLASEIIDDTLYLYDYDGTLLAKSQYKNGKENGVSYSFHDSGDTSSISYYKNGQRHGSSISFFRNGKINIKQSFRNGKPDGYRIKHYPSGFIESKTYYRDGEIVGWVEKYDKEKNGRLWLRYYIDSITGEETKTHYYDTLGNEIPPPKPFPIDSIGEDTIYYRLE